MPATTREPEPSRGVRVLGGHAALVVAQVCFGLFPLFGRWAFQSPGGFTPLAVASWRILFGSGALLALAFLVHRRDALPRLRDVPLLLLCSILGVVLNQVLFLEGLERSTATNAGLVMCLIPVFTFAIAALARQERFEGARAAGLCVALLGGSMLFWAQGPEFRSAYGFGNLLMAINALSYSIYLVISRPLVRRCPPLAVIAWVYALSLLAVPFTLRGEHLWHEGVSTRAALSLAYILVFPTTIAYLLNVMALARVSASTTAVYIYMQPLIAAGSGILLLGEQPSPGLFAAGALIFAGIWLVARRRRTEPAPARPEEHLHGDAAGP